VTTLYVLASLLISTGRSVRGPSEVADEQLAELVGGKWLREVEALPHGAADHIELGGLILGLHAPARIGSRPTVDWLGFIGPEVAAA
jgi:hypothetical protein